jgi:UDP-2-acetamido-3-amino-2,3-dideoxy-glucuronate N-acetyltransferase
MEFFCHPTAVIDEDCSIGEGTKIWHFSHLLKGAVIGKNCVLGQNVMLGSKVVLGDNVHVQNNVSVYEGVTCEEDVFIGPSVVFTNVINPRSAISRKNEFRPTLIRKGATIGANATIICGIEIGSYAFIGAGAIITKTVLPYALVIGNPGRQTGWMSEQGYKLQFNDQQEAICPQSGQKYLLSNHTVLRIL